MPEKCENCGSVIGNLETPQLWQDHVVCVRCAESLAASAPVVNYAAAPAPFAQPAPFVQTVEKTSKKWKLQMMLAAGCVVLGIVLTCAGLGTAGPNKDPMMAPIFVGAWMVVGGFVWLIVVKMLSWWHHG